MKTLWYHHTLTFSRQNIHALTKRHKEIRTSSDKRRKLQILALYNYMVNLIISKMPAETKWKCQNINALSLSQQIQRVFSRKIILKIKNPHFVFTQERGKQLLAHPLVQQKRYDNPVSVHANLVQQMSYVLKEKVQQEIAERCRRNKYCHVCLTETTSGSL